MTILRSDQLDPEGISLLHANSFLTVAAEQACVILTRTPGPACLMPLAEGYDAKGFHVKGKSCDWGPMAGFICAEPLFNKSGIAGALANLKAHVASLTVDFDALANAAKSAKDQRPVYSGLVPLEISEARYNWLLSKGHISKHTGADANTHTGESLVPGTASKVKWLLKYDPTRKRWAIYYDPESLPKLTPADKTTQAQLDAAQTKLADKLVRASTAVIGKYRPVLALSNPYLPYTGEYAHKNALTGDFDLFAVWPHRTKKDLADFEARVASMGATTTTQDIYAAEKKSALGSVVGNISDGVSMIAGALNSRMEQLTGHSKVNRLFHSDEGGRPGITEIDASVGFHPDGKCHNFSDNSPDFAKFVLECARQGYIIFLNNGWIATLKNLLKPAEWTELEKKIRWQESPAPSAGSPTG